MADSHLEDVLSGDDEAYFHIVKAHKDDAYTLAMSVVKNEMVAHDVVQVAFIKAYSKLHTFRKESKFSTWFYRIVINEAFNQNKKKQIENEFLENISMDEVSIGELNDVFSKIEKDNQQKYINEALLKLPSNYSLALRLFYLEECSLKEITEITGWTNAKTRVLLHRARKEIKRVLTKLLNINKEDIY